MTSPMMQSTFWILIALADQRRHGYEILKETAAASEGAVTVKATTLYAALERMERDGLIQPDGEEIVNGRARRYYVISDQGATALAGEVAMLERQAQVARARLGRERFATLQAGFTR